jgi:STAS domain
MPVAIDAPVSLSGTYTFPSFDRLLSQLAPLLRLDEPQPLQLDMSGVSFIGPTAIAVIQACLRRLEAEQLIDGGWFALPRNELTSRYLLRMDLFRRLKAFVDPEETFHRREPIAFRPLSGFEDEKDRIRVVFELLNALKASCKVDALAEQSTFILLTELTENVLQRAPTGVAPQGARPKARP